jgi:glutamate dehydrogenase/leucine dehydrogenase
VVQGWGNLGAATGFCLSQMGVKIVGMLTEKVGSLIKQDFHTKRFASWLLGDKETGSSPMNFFHLKL